MANQSDIKLNIQVTVTGQQTLSTLSSSIQKVAASQANLPNIAARATAALTTQKQAVSGLVNQFGQPLQNALKNTAAGQIAAGSATKGATTALVSQGSAALQSATYSSRLSSAQQTMASWMSKTQKAVRGQSTELSGLAQTLSNAETRYDALYRASYRLQIVGYQLIGAGQNMIGVVKNLTDAWGGFEFMINRAAASMSIWKGAAGAINPIYNALIDNVEQATKDLRLFPAEDVAKATYFWGSTTGQTVSNLADLKVVMQAVNPLMKVAAMTQVDYETAIKGVYSIIVQYGRSLNDVADVTAKLFVVTQKTALEFPDLITSFKMVGPIANSLGVSFEDVASVLGQLGDAGLRGSLSGRALRQVFIQLARPTAKASAALDILFKSTKGINKSFQETVFPNGQFIGVTGFVNDLAIALKDATEAQRAHLLATISTANELPVLTVLVGNQIKVLKQIPGAYDNSKASVSDAAKAAADFNNSWSLLADSWKGITGRITAGAEVIKLKVGRDIADALRPAIDRVTQFLDKIEKWVTMNPQIVTTIGKIAGATAALTTMAGAVLVSIGSMLGLYSALGFLATGFGKLIAPVTIVGGLFVTLGQAIIRNWTRISREVGGAIQNLIKALGISGGTVDKVKSAWASLHKTINDFMDFVVRVASSAISMLINALATLANSPLRGFFEFIIPQFVALVAIWKVVATAAGIIAGVITAIKVASLALSIQLFSLKLGFLGVAQSSALAGGGIAGIKAAIMSLSLTGVVAIVTAIVFGFQLLASMNLGPINDFIDNLTHGVSELKNEVADLISELGKSGKTIGSTLENLAAQAYPEAEKYKKTIEDINNQVDAARNKGDRGAMFGLGIEAQKAAASLDSVTRNQLKDQIVALDKLKKEANDAGVSYDAFGSKVAYALNGLGLSWDNAQKYAVDFFNTVKGGSPTVEEAVTLWNKLAREGALPNISPAQFLKQTVSQSDIQQYVNDYNAKIQIALAKTDLSKSDYRGAYQIAQSLKADSSKYSNDVNMSIDTLLGGIPETIKNITQESVDLATKTPKDITDAVIAGVSAVKNFKSTLKTAMSGLMDPKAFVRALLGNIGSKDIANAFSSSLLGATNAAQASIDTMISSFADALSSAGEDPKSIATMRNAVKSMFKAADFKAALAGTLTTFRGVRLTPAQMLGFQQVIDSLFPELVPPPSGSVVKATGAALAQKFPKMLAAEFDPRYARENAPVSAGAAALADAVKGMSNAWTAPNGGKDFLSGVSADVKESFHIDLFSGGYNTAQSWISGLKAALKVVLPVLSKPLGQVASWTKGKSPPPAGPLHTIDTGGYNIGRAWGKGLAGGMTASIGDTYAAVNRVQNAMSIENGGLNSNLNIDTNASRHIQVDVNVTSSDGSVSRVDMKTLAGALSGTALTRAIEQAAAAR